MKNTLFSSSLMAFSLLLAACGGSGGDNNVADKPQAPQTANSITGHIQKPGGGHEPVTTTSLDYTTYKGVLVSLREEDAVMNLEDQPWIISGQPTKHLNASTTKQFSLPTAYLRNFLRIHAEKTTAYLRKMRKKIA